MYLENLSDQFDSVLCLLFHENRTSQDIYWINEDQEKKFDF